jgi:hypothetical protein
MNIEVFVFNYGRFEQAMGLYDRFQSLGHRTYLLNCFCPDDPQFEASDTIIKMPNVYYSGQWNKALDLAEKEVMFLINSDVSVPNARKLMSRMAAYYDKYQDRAGVYGPNHYWTPWTYNPSILEDIGDGLKKVPSTDSTLWALPTSIARRIGHIPLDVNKLGWGIEIVAAYYCFLENKLVVRDYGIKCDHPESTAYSRDQADEQQRNWINNYLQLGDKYWQYYDTREDYGFGWTADADEEPVRKLLL